MCIRSKKVDAPHKGQLPLPKTAWDNFSTDLSAAFNRPSLYGNLYQMVIIDNKSKYVWDYYLQTKDQAYDKIKECTGKFKYVFDDRKIRVLIRVT